jgi:CheY-like chemotaxis protein
VLLVDDEEAVLQVAGAMLIKLGCEVTKRTDSATALDAFTQAPNEFDVVVTDQSMPGGLGTDLVRELRQVRGDVPVVVFTGFSAASLEDRMEELGIQVLLSKPFRLRELATAVQEALGRESS